MPPGTAFDKLLSVFRRESSGRLAQLVRALPSHGRGHWSESSSAHHSKRENPQQNKGFPRFCFQGHCTRKHNGVVLTTRTLRAKPSGEAVSQPLPPRTQSPTVHEAVRRSLRAPPRPAQFALHGLELQKPEDRGRDVLGFVDNGSEGVIDEESLIFETSTSVTRRPSRTDPYRESRIPHPDPWGILPPAYGSDHTTSPLRTSRERPPPKCPRLRELSSSYVISLITGRITRVTSRFVNAMLVPEVHRFHSYTQIEAIAKPAAASAVSSKPPYLFRENRCNSGRAASTMPPL